MNNIHYVVTILFKVLKPFLKTMLKVFYYIYICLSRKTVNKRCVSTKFILPTKKRTSFFTSYNLMSRNTSGKGPQTVYEIL